MYIYKTLNYKLDVMLYHSVGWSRTVDTIRHLCQKPPRTNYGIQMTREELQIIWVKKLTSLTKRTHKSHTSTIKKKPHKYSTTTENQDDSPQ